MADQQFKEKIRLQVIDEMTGEMKRIRRKTVNDFKAITKSAKTTNNTFKATGNGLKGLAAQFIGVSFAIYKTRQAYVFLNQSAIDYGKTMSMIKAVVTRNETELKDLEKEVRKLGETTAFSASEVGSAFVELGKLGFKTNQILASGNAILDLAAASQADMQQAATVTASTLNQFSLDASEAKRITDLMAKSFTSSALDINKFQESMKYVGTTARLIGVDLKTTTAMLSVLADNSIEASMAGTSLNQAMIQLSDPTSKVNKLFRQGGVETESFINKMEFLRSKNIDVGQAFGLLDVRAARALNILIDQKDKVEDLTDSYDDLNNDAKEMAKIMLNNVAGATKILTSASEGLGIALGDAFSESKMERIEIYTDIVRGATKWVKEHKKELKSLGEKINDVFKDVTRRFRGGGPFNLEVIEQGKVKLKEYLDILDKAEPGMYVAGDKLIDQKDMLKIAKIEKEYRALNKTMSEQYPIENAKESLRLITDISKTLERAAPITEFKRFEPYMKTPGAPKKAGDGVGIIKTKKQVPEEFETAAEATAGLRAHYAAKQKLLDSERDKKQQELDLARETGLQKLEIEQIYIESQAEGKEKELALLQNKYQQDMLLYQNNIDMKKALEDKYTEDKKASIKKYAAFEKQSQKALISQTVSNILYLAGERKKQSALYKIAASAETLMSTYEGAQKTFTSFSNLGPWGVAAGTVAAGIATAAGLKRVADINGIEFHGGGDVMGLGNRGVNTTLLPGESVLSRAENREMKQPRNINITVTNQFNGPIDNPVETGEIISNTIAERTREFMNTEDEAMAHR